MRISKKREDELNAFLKEYNLEFKNIELLNQAFVHTSYTNENSIDVLESYERLEFLGDAVLKLAISDILYNEYNYQEGELTKIRAQIVSDRNIFNYAKKLNFQELIALGRNEKKQGGYKKESILACAFEAFLGAIFLEYKDLGYKIAYEFLKENFLEDILSVENSVDVLNPKAILQEYTQGKNKKLPEYILKEETGKAHKKTFVVQVMYENDVLGEGTAESIKKAQQEAARNALIKLKILKEKAEDKK